MIQQILLKILEYFIAPLIVGLILLAFSKRKKKPIFDNKKKGINGIKEENIKNISTPKLNGVLYTISLITIGISVGLLIFSIITTLNEIQSIKSDSDLLTSKTIQLNEDKISKNYIETSRSKTNGQANAVFVRDNFAFITSEDGLQIFEIQDNNPYLISSVNIKGNTIDVFINDIYAYTLSEDGIVTTLSIINIEDKLHPKIINSYQCPFSLLDLSGNPENNLDAYNLPIPEELFIKDNWAFILDQRGLKIFDINDKNNINLVGSCDTYYAAESIFINENYAFIADTIDGIQIINIENKQKPVIKGMYETEGQASDIYIEGDTAYVADRSNGLIVFDVSHKLGINYSDRYNSSINYENGYIKKVFKENDYVYAISNGDILIMRINENDIFSSSSLNLIDTFKTPGEISDFFVKDGVIYVADLGYGFEIIKKIN